MHQQTESEARAQRLGWPLGVQGYGPNERQYYVEPALDWVNCLLNPTHYDLDPDACQQQLARLAFLPRLWNDNMAPRFAAGTTLAGHRVRVGQPVAVGAVLCFWLPGEAKDCAEWARVVSCAGGELRLACDNGQRPYCLPWTKADARRVGRVYQVTHYCSQPFPGYE